MLARTHQGICVASKAPPPTNDVLEAAVRYLSPDGPHPLTPSRNHAIASSGYARSMHAPAPRQTPTLQLARRRPGPLQPKASGARCLACTIPDKLYCLWLLEFCIADVVFLPGPLLPSAQRPTNTPSLL